MSAPVRIIGVDCATQPRKTGLACARWSGGAPRLEEARRAHPSEPAAAIVAGWMDTPEPVLLCLDAPLGWPSALARELAGHQAGAGIAADADAMFHRHTDRVIRERLGKRPLEVGANFIARTALAAVNLLQVLRDQSGRALPLPRVAGPVTDSVAIEVYPAALRRVRGWDTRGDVRTRLPGAFAGPVPDLSTATDDTLDAVLCVLAGVDFLAGHAVPPTAAEAELAGREGWIWSADPDPFRSAEAAPPRRPS
ncbi:DUF429 domain-containing protein [Thioalkalivibrio sp. ALJ16]|uniref:DUF429 domain-containing protein n=1 Tax=Thioalkalivibrio sp. ALJ16 TaxID=1158762 RepID=UPI00035F8417|nr:DUF429 domain-containing protein [Thioalkalivibrio sp. ALJ16]